jgi:hypothetical protein
MKIETSRNRAAYEQGVIHGDAVYFAGIVADSPKGKSDGSIVRTDPEDTGAELGVESRPTSRDCRPRRCVP